MRYAKRGKMKANPEKTKKKFSSSFHKKTTRNIALDVGFQPKLAGYISNANADVDGDWWFDGIKWVLVGSQELGYPHYMTDVKENREYNWKLSECLIQIKFQIGCRHLLLGDIKTACIYFGHGLHTLQDRCSHTNDVGEPMTDKEHGLLRGTDNPKAKPILSESACEETRFALQQFYEVYKTKKCPINCTTDISKPCKMSCEYWLNLKGKKASFW